MYAMFTQHNDKYFPLSRYTWDQNKLIYAKKHNYATHVKTDEWKTGFDKIHFAKEILNTNPNYKWLWWTGTDSIITNMNIRIEDRVMNQYHFIISADINGINADSWFIRNTPEGLSILNDILSKEDECLKEWDHEQLAMCKILGLPKTGQQFWPPHGPIEITDKYKDIVKIVPQKYCNSYNYKLYKEYIDHRDRLGYDGNWSFGDWLIHWPALSIDTRIELFQAYAPYVVR